MKHIEYKEGMEINDPCIIANMPNEAYHSEKDYLSKSGLDLFSRSPAHFYCASPRESTRAMDIGTAIHTAVLEPERFAQEYMLLPDSKDRRSSMYKEAAKQYGKECVLVASEIEKVKGMQEACSMNSDYINGYAIKKHSVELSFFGICIITGVKIKCRFDMLTECSKALDLKKTQDVRQDVFSRSILNYRYHVQHAFYSHVYACVTGKALESFEFFCVEESSPHSNIIYALDEETKQIGNNEMMADLQAFAANDNPAEGIYQSASITGLPVWYLNQNAIEGIE